MNSEEPRSSGEPTGRRDSRERAESSWAVFRLRGFVRLWGAAVLTQLGVQTIAFSLPLALFIANRDPLEASVVGGAYALSSIISRVPAGVLVDRWNRKRTLIVALTAHAALLGTLGAWVAINGSTLPPLLLIAVLNACVSSVYSPTQTAMIRAIVARVHLPAAMSQYVARQYVAGLLGPVLGGVLIAWVPGTYLIVPAALLLTSVLLVSTLTVPDGNGPTKERKPFFVEMANGIRFIFARPAFRGIVAFTSALTLAMSMFFFAIALRVVDLGVPTSAVGVIESASALGLIAGAALAPWLVARVKMWVLASGASMILACGFLATTTTGVLVALCVIVVAIVLVVPAADAAGTAYIIAVTPSDLQGRVGSTVGFVTNLFTPLAPVLVSAAVASFGTTGALIACAVIAVVAAVAMTMPAVRSANLAHDSRDA